MNGLSGPFSTRAPGDCGRCRRVVEATWPWGGWGGLRRVFFAIVALLLVLSPFFFADMYIMLPSALTFVFATGPVNTLAKIKPTCLECGGPVSRIVVAAPAALPERA